MTHRSLRWLAAALLWSALGLLFTLPNLASGQWGSMLVGSLAQWWSWGLVTPLIFWIDRRLPLREDQLGWRILAHLPTSVAVTILYFYVTITLASLFGLGRWGMLAKTSFLPMDS